MGYRIIYGEDQFVPDQPRKSRLKTMTAGFALALVILVRLFWPRGTEVLQQILLPGDNAALTQLTEDIRAGEPVGEAVTTFCRSIVDQARDQTD